MISTRTRTPERTEFLADIITTAVEGGIGYWSQVSEYHWYSPDLDGGTAEHADGMPNAYVTIHESDTDGTVATIGIDDVARALGAIRKGGVTGLSEDGARRGIMEADRDNDAGDIDAGDADIIVQVAMFGSVIYG